MAEKPVSPEIERLTYRIGRIVMTHAMELGLDPSDWRDAIRFKDAADEVHTPRGPIVPKVHVVPRGANNPPRIMPETLRVNPPPVPREYDPEALLISVRSAGRDAAVFGMESLTEWSRGLTKEERALLRRPDGGATELAKELGQLARAGDA